MSTVEDLRASNDPSRIKAGILLRERKAALLIAEAYGLKNYLEKSLDS